MPLASADGRVAITYNGEIYNYRDVRARLAPYPFRTESDTEVVVAAYLKWGVECVRYFEGMFAFCLYDSARDFALLAVDPAGQKPLYYAPAPDGLWFSSDLKSLVATGAVAPGLDAQAIAQAMGIYFIFGGATHLRGIKKLESGCRLTVEGAGAGNGARVSNTRYYRVPLAQPGAELRETEAISAVRDAAVSACRSSFSLEVPYAHLLSGGIDSSLVVALAAREKLELDTFSIGFAHEGEAGEPAGIQYNEFSHSRQVAAHFGTNHTQITLTPADYAASLAEWTQICNEPHGAPEAVSLLSMFAAIREKGFRVAFCGSGPDEIFDGYAHGHRLAACPPDAVARAYFRAFGGMGKADPARLMPGIDAESAFAEAVQPYLDLYEEENPDSATLACLLDFHGIYPVCEFRQIDMASMAHGIEVRSPLAEQNLVRAAFSLPAGLRYRDGSEKWVFKQAAREFLPASIVNRKKAGFPIPPAMFLSPAFEALAAPMLEAGSGLDRAGLFDLSYLRALWRERTPEARAVFYRLFMAGAVIERDLKAFSEAAG